MPIWPFKRQAENLSPEELRARLISAASGPNRKLRNLCKQYKEQIAANAEFMCKAPQGIASDSASIDNYIQCLGAVAHCLATECDAPELWNELCGTPDDNPLIQWERWYEELPQRMECLEYEALIAEAKSFIEQAKSLEGQAARQNESFLLGRLGELLFNSGNVHDAIEPFSSALELCRQTDDLEGQSVYLGNLLEVYRYLGDVKAAISTGEELVQLNERQGREAESIRRHIQRIRNGEPLCRVVCVRDAEEWELNKLPNIEEGSYAFHFRRNRLSLQKSIVLVQQGNDLASKGELADALEKYQEATEIDPHDPDPLYQSGMCLLELGAYNKAREVFEQVEQVAPGWFRCRSDAWLAESLESGVVSDDEFRILRMLDDGGLNSDEARPIAEQAVRKYSSFAPFYLILGNLQRDMGETDRGIATYRAGLERATEPDLESRLLCALAGALPKESPERRLLVERAVGLKGNMVAEATARILEIV